MTPNQRDEIWENKLTAKFNVCYYGCLARRAEVHDRWIRIGIAVLSSSTVLALFAKAGSPWKESAAVLTAIFSVYYSVTDPPKRLARYSELRSGWLQLAHAYHYLWTDHQGSDDQVISSDLKNLRRSRIEREKEESLVPDQEKLKVKCQEEVLRQEGLFNESAV